MPSEYERGYAEGYAARESEFEGLQRVADYWYFRACNPGAKSADEKAVDSIIAGMEANEEWRRKREALDAAEHALFDEARGLIAEGLDDVTIATKVGLFVPIVENIRAGVL
jgi:hypothetical protein